MALAGRERKPALTAAASKFGYSRISTQKLRDAPWQDRAWQVYEAEGSIYFMTRYRSAIARKIDYFAAFIDSPGDDPNVDGIFTEAGEYQGPGEAAKVLEAEGGPELLRRLVSELMVHWDVPGEGYLVRFDAEPFWRILSTQELKKSGDRYAWGDDFEKVGEIDPEQVYRVWKPHPRFHWQADSPTRHVLEDAEELILLRRELRARSESRLPAGAWVLPSGVDLSPFADDEEGSPDSFGEALTAYLSAAVKDKDSASRLAPWILTVDPSDHAMVVSGFINFHRDWDVPMEQREALLRSIATGLDVPPEILTGMADLNHWSAWLVSEQAVSQHVAPTVDDILDSLTTNWFRPLLEAASVDPDKYVLWRDLSPATVPPDRTDTALEMFKEGIIDDSAVRRVSDFDEEDAPEEPEEGFPPMDADELLKRINALGMLRRSGADWESANRAVGLPPIELIPGLLPITVKAEEVVKNEEAVVSSVPDWFIQEVAKKLKEGDPPLAEAAVTAAVARRVDAKPLADIDRELLAWLVEETQKEIDRVLGVVEKTLTAATDPLDESLLSRFRSRVDRKIAEAQERARTWVEGLTGRPTQFEDEEQTRSVGLDLIIGGVIEAIRRRLFTPSARPDPIDVGDLPDTIPPIDVLRRGLSVAGGGEPQFDDQATIDMIGNGQRIHDELSDNGFHTELMRWVYGHPANSFEPHRRLRNTEFDSWESPKLEVGPEGSWLGRTHYRPGDHRGCQCSVEQVLIHPEPEEPETDQSDLRALNAERLAKFENNPRPGIDDNPEIVAAARERFEHVMRREAEISRFLRPIAGETDARFQHFGERVKFESSIRDKIWREMQADPSLTVQQAAENVTDGNRYTLMWEADSQFASRHARTVQSFNDSGWRTIADKNGWAPGDAYDGMNYKFQRGDDIVEVQFHTPASAQIKDRSHLLYSEARIMPPGPEKDRMLQEVLDLWNTNRLHVPPGMEMVGTQTWYDL